MYNLVMSSFILIIKCSVLCIAILIHSCHLHHCNMRAKHCADWHCGGHDVTREENLFSFQ